MTVAPGAVIEENDGPLRVISLARPGRRNAMDTAMLEALDAAVRRAARDPLVRAVLLSGEGDDFSSGGDAAEMTGSGAGAVVDRWTHISAAVTSEIFNAEKPVVSAVDGTAVGAGCALALACDVVLLSERAMLSPVFTRRGIVPDHAALWFLPRLCGLLAAKEIVFSGRTIGAAEARRIGLCTDVLPVDGFAKAARDRARVLADGPTRALGMAKLGMHRGLSADLWTVQAFERAVMPGLFSSDDAAEGFAALRERREPRFSGR